MKAVLIFATVSLVFFSQSIGQTFTDCANEYADQYNKIALQSTLKKIAEETADSLINQINNHLDECIIGKEIPDIELIGKSGKVYKKEDLKGKVVMLNFWSLACLPCVMEIPVLNKLHESYAENDDFIILSILYHNEDDLQKFLDGRHVKRNISYEVIPNLKPLLKSTFNFVKSFPINLFIDREGKVFMKNMGGITDPKLEKDLELKLRAIIDAELNKS